MFMQLSTGERRKFVEVVLNLIVFSNMAKIHNLKTSELKQVFRERLVHGLLDRRLHFTRHQFFFGL